MIPELFIEAASKLQRRPFGCCRAIELVTYRREPDGFVKWLTMDRFFDSWFRPIRAASGSYWWADPNISLADQKARQLALCFAAHMWRTERLGTAESEAR